MSQRRALQETFVALAVPETAQTEAVLPLEAGDRLTRVEFERRYNAMPELKKAELIEGVVYMGSPVSYQKHGRPHSIIGTLVGLYCLTTPGVSSADNGTLRLDDENAPQPDLILRIEEDYGGQSVVTDDDYLEGGPELIVEVASSSASYDLHAKRKVYRRHGVREYIAWRTRDRALDWFVLEKGRYVRLAPNAQGVCESKVFPGLRLALHALLQGDYAAALQELQAGLASAEHQAFVAHLAKQKKEEQMMVARIPLQRTRTS